jgi:hypothetical protein
MLKKALFSMVFLGMSVAPLFAQSNVDKAVRFRAKAPNPEVAVQNDAATRIEQTKELRRIPALLAGSSAQLRDLGGFIWNHSDRQLEDLGGYIWANSGSQLEGLGQSRYAVAWFNSGSQLKDLGPTARPPFFSAGQLKDLGSRYAVGWTKGSSRLDTLGSRYAIGWTNSDSQLEDLGGYIWNNSDSQLKDLGGYIWNNSDSQLKDLGGYIWANSGTQLKNLGCPYCNRGNQFSTGQLEDLGRSRWIIFW